MAEARMREFWDARADEDPFYFVDNRLTYRDADLDRFWKAGEADLEKMLSALDFSIPADAEVVEIGCGVGRITRVLAARAASVRALDVSGRMLERARELNPDLDNVEWILGDGRGLGSIASESADVCHSYVVFHHIPDSRITLGYVREMGRVLRPGGWAAFGVSNDPGRHVARRGRIVGVARSILRRGPRGQRHPAWLGSAVDLAELEAVAGEAGMAMERVAGASTLYCVVLLRKRET